MADVSTTKTSTRIGILVGASVFLLSSIAATVFTIIDMSNNDDTTTANTDTTISCSMDEQPPAETLPTPEVFKPTADVTELETTTLTAGSGDPVQAGACLQMKYYGTLPDGTFFDGNFDKPIALQFALGQGSVIQGWDRGVLGMQVGETRRIVIPSDLGYGEGGSGSIPPNSDLVFIVKLEAVKA